MSEELPSDEGQEYDFTDLSAFDSVASATRRLSRNGLIAVAAGVVLACGVGVGFAYVSSDPAADVAAAVPGPPSSPETTTSPTTVDRSSAFAGSGKDVFHNTVAPSTSSAASGAGGVTTTAPTTAAPSTTAPLTVSSPGGSGGVGSAGASRTTTATVKPPITTPPAVTTAPTTPVSVPVASPTKSALPSWTVPAITYDAVDGANGVFNVGGGLVSVAPGERIYPLNVVFVKLSGTVAVLAEATHQSTRWQIPLDPENPVALPSGAVGNPVSRLRVYGVLDSKYYWTRIDDQTGKTYKVDDLVAGTDFIFKGVGDDGIVRFEDSKKGILFEGSFGAGEADGVSF
ncbi:hypothetical protein FHR75_003681 [Kineococcus radiotolerans]|uniref:Uncharacterized protein n=1 Tax=Kineococcus radiotolerans TaxID=131568 RepID=A0A7W4TQ18_KINRA|nr:hypothetical protein [Kineococcus radiotolerans]MBB2902845.1 hypothetical protein [Kineococcus radiotolerans]